MSKADRSWALILASRSPRRRQLLAEAGYRFEVCPPREDIEVVESSESRDPAELVARLAYRKAEDVAQRISRGLILGCDTVAECGGRILGKPEDRADARRMLETLRGRRHRVLSGLCLWKQPGGVPLVRVDATTLCMDQLSEAAIGEYLASGAWQGKAGAFGYQDRLGWVRIVEGSESNVVGLPMELLARMLEEISPQNAPPSEPK
jgi:septum formation protein